MKRRRHKPSYSLSMAKELARSGDVSVNGRSIRFIRNHISARNPGYVVRQVIEVIDERDFKESYELDILPGTWADVYETQYEGEEWYVKFFIGDNGDLRLHVLSANWLDYIH